MDALAPFILDWLNLLLRWAHLIAGIAWIGTSFYFIALDRSLRREADDPEGVFGSAWEVHGGGFYHVRKYMVAPSTLPERLTWFRWEAYLTWVTGFSLLVVQFYFNASIWLIDPQVMPLEPWQGVAISFSSLFIGWFVYHAVCRSPLGNNLVALAITVFALLVFAAWGYMNLFSARSALLHTGMLIGTLMAFNVFAVIIPNQKKITASLLAGEPPDPTLGLIGKQRSVHNTYLTLPVILLMLSGHYPMIGGHPQAWLLVALFLVGGGITRHVLLRIESGARFGSVAWLLLAMAGILAILVGMTAPKPVADGSGPGAGVGGQSTERVSDLEVLRIVYVHCVSCHARHPLNPDFTNPPNNVVLETTADILRFKDTIEAFSVRTHIMPLGNKTDMSEQERERLGLWLSQAAADSQAAKDEPAVK